MKFTCFRGAAAVTDEAVVVARDRSRRRGMSSFRGKFLSGNKGKKSASAAAGTKRSPRREVDDIYDMIVAGAMKSSSVPSSSALSSTASMDSSSSCSSSLSSSTASSFLEVAASPAEQKRSPAAGAAAVVVCLVMMMFCGLFAATLLTSTAFYIFPRRWPARAKAESVIAAGVAPSSEYDVASAREEETVKRKAVMEGFLVRNRKS